MTTGPSSGASLAEELASIAARAQTYTGGNGAAIALSEGNAAEIVCRAASGPTAPDVGTHLRLEGSFTGLCVQTGQALRCDDSDNDPRVDAAACRALGTRSIVVVPVRDAETESVIGVLAAFAGTKNTFTDLHVAVLRTMAREIAVAVSKAKKSGTGVAAPAAVAAPAPRAVTTSSFTSPAAAAPAPAPSRPITDPGVPTPPPIKPAAPTPAAVAPTVITPVPPLPKPAPKPQPARADAVTSDHVAPPKPAATPPPVWKPAPPPPPRQAEKVEVEPIAAPIKPKPAAPPPAPRPSAPAPAPSFGTFDRVAQDQKPGGSGMMIWVGVGVLAVVAVGGYFAYSKLAAKPEQPVVAATPAPAPAESQPATSAPTEAAPATAAPPTTTAQPAATTQPATTAPAKATPPPASTTAAAKPAPPQPTQPAPARPEPQAVARELGTSAAGSRQEEAPRPIAVPTQQMNVPIVPTTAAPPPPAPMRVSQTTPAQLLTQVAPRYPMAAKAMRAEGDVVLQGTVGKDGAVQNVKVVSGHSLLRDAAASAFRQWKYKPATLNGQAVESQVTVTMKFTAPR